jgi:hypothetical protein
MRSRFRLLRAVIILTVLVVGLGLARGWFYVSRPNDLDHSKMNVQFTVDTEKVKDDSAKVKNAAGELSDKVVGEARHLQHGAATPNTPPAPLVPNPSTPDQNLPNPAVK